MKLRILWLVFVLSFVVLALALLQRARAQEQQAAVCLDKKDIYELALADTQGNLDWTEKIQSGECAAIPASALGFLTILKEYQDSDRHQSYIAEVYFRQKPLAHAYALLGAMPTMVLEVTWRPEFGTSPQAWINWFMNARTTPAVTARTGFNSCCAQSDRFVTSFKHDDHWYFMRNNVWVEIPDDTIEPEDPKMPDQLKEEGVLFVYNGLVTCFWPPSTGG